MKSKNCLKQSLFQVISFTKIQFISSINVLKWLLISSDIAHISGCQIKLCQGFDLLAKGTVNVVTEYLTIHSAALQNMFKDSLSDEMFTMRSWQEMLTILFQ